MSLSITGRIHDILQEEKGTSKAGKEWRKQAFVVDTGDQYNPYVCFSVFGDEKIGMLSQFKRNDQVEVSFNLSSRDFNGKWYHNVDAWRIQKHDGSATGAPAGATAAASAAQMASGKDDPFAGGGAEEDDLPF
jgi:hypothetical protein